jgi:hypothetical protein
MILDELCYYNEENASSDPDWAALASDKYGSVRTADTAWAKKDTSFSPLENYHSLVELNPDIYEEAKDKSVEFWKQRVNKLVNFTRTEAFRYYKRRVKMY